MRRSDFIFNPVQLLYYKCHKINFRCGGSSADFPDWMKKERARINLKNKCDEGFQYAIMIALNYREIESHPERLWNIKLLVNKYNWDRIKYLQKIDDSKIFEKSNPTVALNILYIKEKEVYPAYISKINSNCESKLFF